MHIEAIVAEMDNERDNCGSVVAADDDNVWGTEYVDDREGEDGPFIQRIFCLLFGIIPSKLYFNLRGVIGESV